MTEQRKTKTTGILEQLQEEVKAVFDSDAYKQWLRFVSKSRHYSWANTLQIWMQAPESQYAASYSDFKNKHCRYVEKGAKQIRIICPHTIREEDQYSNTRVYTGFHAGTLYWLEDTEPMRGSIFALIGPLMLLWLILAVWPMFYKHKSSACVLWRYHVTWCVWILQLEGT